MENHLVGCFLFYTVRKFLIIAWINHISRNQFTFKKLSKSEALALYQTGCQIYFWGQSSEDDGQLLSTLFPLHGSWNGSVFQIMADWIVGNFCADI